MAIIKVTNVYTAQTTGGSDPFVATLGFTPTEGNLLIALVATITSDPVVGIASDGATWVNVASSQSSSSTNPRVDVYQSGILGASPGSSVTVDMTNTSNVGPVIVAEIELTDGEDGSAPVTAFDSGASGTISVGPFTNTEESALIVGALARADHVGGTFTNVSPPEVSIHTQVAGSGGGERRTLALVTGRVGEAVSRTISSTITPNDTWAAVQFALIETVTESTVETRADVEVESWSLKQRGLVTSGVDIPSHQVAGLARLIAQYRLEADKLKAILDSWLVSCQDLEDVLWDIQGIRDIDTATGVNLDRIGAILGQPRGALSDTNYRPWLRAKALANRASGRVDEILEAVRLAEPGATIIYSEFYPAEYIIETYGISSTETMAGLMTQMKPAGVGAQLYSSTASASGIFTFSDDTVTIDGSVGFSDDEITDPGGVFVDVTEL